MRNWLNLFEGLEYPMADRDRDGWWSDGTYEVMGGKIVMMSPDEYLSRVRPLDLDDESEENIEELMDRISNGLPLDPLKIYSDGKEDGRHRAHAAKRLGVEEVPVIVFPPLNEEAETKYRVESYYAPVTGFGPYFKVVGPDGKEARQEIKGAVYPANGFQTRRSAATFAKKLNAQEINESQEWTTVYHGHQDPTSKPHKGKFFTTDPDFAGEYGTVSVYEVKLGRVLDTTDAEVAEQVIIPLEIYDPYDGSDVTMEYWSDYQSDTWEFTEEHLDDIIARFTKVMGHGVDSVKVTEGGIENYIVLDTKNMRFVKQLSD